jgi:hypothetical protein
VPTSDETREHLIDHIVFAFDRATHVRPHAVKRLLAIRNRRAGNKFTHVRTVRSRPGGSNLALANHQKLTPDCPDLRRPLARARFRGRKLGWIQNVFYPLRNSLSDFHNGYD